MRQYALSVRLGLLLKNFPRRHAHDARFDSRGVKLLVRVDAETDLRARAEQNDLGLAALGVGENVRALRQTGGGRIFRSIERRHRLPAQDQTNRLMLKLHDYSPRLGDFVGVARAQGYQSGNRTQ